VQGLSGSIVQERTDGIEVALGKTSQVGVLGQVLAQQAVGVLVGATLPRAMGIGEVGLQFKTSAQQLMARHFAALIVSQRFAQGLGYALFEEMRLDERGAVRNTDLHDYRIPTIGDMPDELEVIFVDGYPSATGPHGAKGVGEAPILLPPAAVAAAVCDLLGEAPNCLPLSADRMSDFLAERDVTELKGPVHAT